MSILFTKAKIGSMELSNHPIRAASHEGLADSRGRPTDEQSGFCRGFAAYLVRPNAFGTSQTRGTED